MGVATPDPTVLARSLSTIMSGVLDSNPDATFRTALVKNELKLDTKPTTSTVMAFHKHLLAEAEALAAGSKVKAGTTAASSEPTRAPAADKPPKIKGLQATGAEATPTPKAKSAPTSVNAGAARPCKWFAKSEGGCRRGSECQFSHEWGTTPKAGRCLLCSSTGHLKKDCPTKDKSTGTAGTRQKPESQPTSPSTAGAVNKAMSTTAEPATSSTTPSQPAVEPSPGTSPSRARPPEEDHPEALRKIMDDASKMLKTLMASSGTTSSPSTATSPPTYESIQRQLDELKLKAMKVDGAETSSTRKESGVLLDSGSTHVLRPAHDEAEVDNTTAVHVTLAGDEKRVLRQAPSGSILLATEDKDRVQTIVPFGAMIDILGCTLKWTKGGMVLLHPRHGRIKTRLRCGFPEMTDAGQAAEIIAELEMKKVEELNQRAQGLQQKLNALRMMEVKKED